MTSNSNTEERAAQKAALWELIDACPPNGLVFFGGAGVSTESGIPDFRSADGLYKQANRYPYPPEVMISRSFFDAHPQDFYEYYTDNMLALDAKPNAAHEKLAELERGGVCRAVITQNIDGLHQAAGSRNVIELHGSVHRNYCMDCGRPFDARQLLTACEDAADGVPRCSCGGIIKPDVVLYEEPLDQASLYRAAEAIQQATLLIVADTSLMVQPAAGLIELFRGKDLVIVNRDETPADRLANLCIHSSIGEMLSRG